MKKLSGSFFPWMENRDKSYALTAEKSKVLVVTGFIKLWHFAIAVLLGAILFGLSAPARGQAVNATLLGSVTDSSGAAVASVKVTITETNTGITRTSPTND